MRHIFYLISLLTRALVRLRYRLDIRGLSEVKKELKKRGEGVLFLSNHTSEVDATILTSLLWAGYKPLPLITEDMYNVPLIHQASKQVGAIPVPNFERALNSYKRRKWTDGLNSMIKGLKKGKNFLVFPSGRLKRTSKEQLKGASGVHEVLQSGYTPQIVLIRLTGLWGSSFSCAQTGSVPPILKMYTRGLGLFLQNLFFLTPKRKVRIDFEIADVNRLKKMSRLELNQELENWYGALYPQGKEPAISVRERFWLPSRPKMARMKSKESLGNLKVPLKVKEAVFAHLKELMGERVKEIRLQDELGTDLGLDSLDIAELLTFLEKRFGVRGRSPDDLSTVASALELAVKKPDEKKSKASSLFNPKQIQAWVESRLEHPEPIYPEGTTIPEVFFKTCDRLKGRYACVDTAAGRVLTYSDLKKGALAITEMLSKVPSKHVGIMLPSSAAAYLLIIACQLAGKIPVMLNWTQGAMHLNSVCGLMKLKTVITSKRFVDEAGGVDFGEADQLFCFLEDMKKSLSLRQKVGILIGSKKSPKALLNRLKRPISKTAAILFTSGTEGDPKAVPLSHSNILANQRSALKSLELKKTDSIFSILPPFHSFGFNVTGLLPWLFGIRNVMSPNPLDSGVLLERIKTWQVSIFCGAPSFLHPVLELAKQKDLACVRLFVTGAESMPEKTHKLILKWKKANFVEGYGMTESSPIVCVNTTGDLTKGVGRPIEGTSVRILNEKTKTFCPNGTSGLVVVSGPSLFSGYLYTKKSPFIRIKKVDWYSSGDIGMFDGEGNLVLTGRSKRIVKIGGEMISLALIEQKLAGFADQKGWPHPLDPNPFACCAEDEDSGKPKLCLYTCIDKPLDEINKALKSLGFTNMVKISRHHHVNHIPLTGVGKIDYQKLTQATKSPEVDSSKKVKPASGRVKKAKEKSSLS